MPNGAHLFLAPISPVIGSDGRVQFQFCKKPDTHYSLYILSTVVGMPEMHPVARICYDVDPPTRKDVPTFCYGIMSPGRYWIWPKSYWWERVGGEECNGNRAGCPLSSSESSSESIYRRDRFRPQEPFKDSSTECE